ncbi:chorismate mutase [Actinocorallia sp. A-T 12471]|uniref:chorismate mutase n=1 Tax=Actinocorallia sp. A-T 12471 TaxID=3089813 RepID=UPI0029CEF226|nr:chorismate mutase [Actinocorallia sp. A-T 12471]MDX6743056.1 chorismate mutase [Actinocorallia sp. A-T 12471]
MRPIDSETATLAQVRAAIDQVDAELAALLERRAALAATVQRIKPVGGHRGRDPEREAAIVAAMAPLAPSLSREHLTKIMNAVIEAGIDASGV